MTIHNRLDVTTFTRFFIGGQGLLRSAHERRMAAMFIALSGALAVAAVLSALSGLLWLVHWAVVASTIPVGSLAETAVMFGQLCAASLGAVTLLFVIRKVVKHVDSSASF